MYTIVRWITAFIGDDPIGEFDSMAGAKKEFRGVLGITFKYSAAEMINDDGDVNPAVYSDSLAGVMNKIKEVL